MPLVKFISTTLTSKGRFEAGESADFNVAQAKDLQRLSSVESLEPAPVKKAKKSKKVKDESEESPKN